MAEHDYTVNESDDLPHEIERGEGEAIFCAMLDALGLVAPYGTIDGTLREGLRHVDDLVGPENFVAQYHVEDDHFLVRSYYWGDRDEVKPLPNFVDKASGLWIKWYKYALRSGTSSRPIAVPELLVMCTDIARRYVSEDEWHKTLANFLVDPAERWTMKKFTVEKDCQATLHQPDGGSTYRAFKKGEELEGSHFRVDEGYAIRQPGIPIKTFKAGELGPIGGFARDGKSGGLGGGLLALLQKSRKP